MNKAVKSLTESMVNMAKAADQIDTRRKRLISAVKAGLKEAQWSERQLARQAPMAVSYLSQILNGVREGPGPDQYLMKAADVLVGHLRKSNRKGSK